MRDPRIECPDCKKRMLPGFLLERGDHNRPSATEWVEGVPRRNFWRGLLLKGQLVVPVVSSRCPVCGYLASFAREAGPR